VSEDCAIVPSTSADGIPYTFDRGFAGTGTGVCCVDADHDGRRDLLGLRRLIPPGADDRTVTWSRTIVRLDGAQASNGPTDTGTYHLPRDAAAADLLSEVTCGDQRPSLTEPQG